MIDPKAEAAQALGWEPERDEPVWLATHYLPGCGHQVPAIVRSRHPAESTTPSIPVHILLRASEGHEKGGMVSLSRLQPRLRLEPTAAAEAAYRRGWRPGHRQAVLWHDGQQWHYGRALGDDRCPGALRVVFVRRSERYTIHTDWENTAFEEGAWMSRREVRPAW